MTKIASEARIIELAKKMGIKIITKGDAKHDRTRKDSKLLSHKS